MRGPLRLGIECPHLGAEAVIKVTVASLEGLTAGELKQLLAIKARGDLPDPGHLSFILAGQDSTDDLIEFEDAEDVGECLPLAVRCVYVAGRTKRQTVEWRADAFARARVLRDQGRILLDAGDEEISQRLSQRRFQSVLRVKKERRQRQRSPLPATLSAPPRIK